MAVETPSVFLRSPQKRYAMPKKQSRVAILGFMPVARRVSRRWSDPLAERSPRPRGFGAIVVPIAEHGCLEILR